MVIMFLNLEVDFAVISRLKKENAKDPVIISKFYMNMKITNSKNPKKLIKVTSYYC